MCLHLCIEKYFHLYNYFCIIHLCLYEARHEFILISHRGKPRQASLKQSPMASIRGRPELWEAKHWVGPLRNHGSWGSSNLSCRMETRSRRLLHRMAQGPLLVLRFFVVFPTK